MRSVNTSPLYSAALADRLSDGLPVLIDSPAFKLSHHYPWPYSAWWSKVPKRMYRLCRWLYWWPPLGLPEYWLPMGAKWLIREMPILVQKARCNAEGQSFDSLVTTKHFFLQNFHQSLLVWSSCSVSCTTYKCELYSSVNCLMFWLGRCTRNSTT